METREANALALHVVRAILDGAHAFETEVDGRRVRVEVSRIAPEAFPSEATGLDLTEAEHGPWPAGVMVTCTWEGGAVRLRVRARHRYVKRVHHRLVALSVGAATGSGKIVYITVGSALVDAEDEANLDAHVSLVKGKNAPERQRELSARLKELVARSGLPMLSDSRIKVCSVDVATGELRPDPDKTFERLIRTALYKLDFISVGPKAKERGAPLVDNSDLLEPGLEIEPDDEDADEDDDVPEERPVRPLNSILYGPPGTGKTYAIQREILDEFRSVERPRGAEYDPAAVDGLTYYQTVAVALHLLGGEASVAELKAHPLVRLRYGLKPVATPLGSFLWGELQAHSIRESTTVRSERRSGALVFDKREDGTWFFGDGTPPDIVALANELSAHSTTQTPCVTFVSFHQSYGYEDFIEGIRPHVTDGDDEAGSLTYRLESGLFLRAVEAAIRLTGFEGTVHEFCLLDPTERHEYLEDAPRYAVLIDEINRGNVSRIFGELITLIEPDKRLGAKNELILTLPYSRRRFGVPSNLHIVGTMNTADRSVEALDVALRRRFSFRRCPPRPDLLPPRIEGGVEPRRLLDAINRRLLKLHDRDHLIGHAYFMSLHDDDSLLNLKAIFRDHVVPLLAEYFYGDLGRIGLVLGSAFVKPHRVEDIPFARFEHDEAADLGDRRTYELRDVDALSNTDFMAIYSDVPIDD